MNDLDPFAVLGISRSADDAIIRASYRLRALEAHPDRAGFESTRRMQSVTAAHALLTDPIARARWEVAHPAAVGAETNDGAATERGAASAPPRGSRTCSAARRRLADRFWQWAATILLFVAVLAASVLGGPAATTVAALSLGLAWLADQVPDRAPFWPARDLKHAARVTARRCLGVTSALLATLMRLDPL